LILEDYQQLLGRAPSQNEINLWLKAFNSGTTDEQVMALFLASPEYYQRTGGTNEAWVNSLYKVVLDRNADAAGEAAWLRALAAGQSRDTVAYGFTASPEHEQSLIQADYQLYLGRSGSASEVSSWLSNIEQGMTQEEMAAEFASSPEAFFVQNNSVVDDWVTYAYQTILGRQPDSDGMNSWEEVLEEGLQ
jgi:hypothetical protein